MGSTRIDRGVTRQMSKKERRETQREWAREERMRQMAARRRRRRIAWVAWPVAGVIAVGVGAAVVVSNVQAGMVGPLNMATDGLLMQGAGDEETFAAASTAALDAGEQPTVRTSDVASSGVLDVQVYLDPTNADSATFWSNNQDSLASYLQASVITVELHPVSFDGSDAGVAAVAAFGCVADSQPDLVWDYLGQLLNATAGGSAPAGDTLVDLAMDAGVTDADTQDCISGGQFRSWSAAASDRAAESVPYASEATAVSDAPVIVVAGQVYTGALDDADAFGTFLQESYTAATGE